MHPRRNHFVFGLSRREISSPECFYRQNYKLLGSIIGAQSRIFHLVQDYVAPGIVEYERDRIYSLKNRAIFCCQRFDLLSNCPGLFPGENIEALLNTECSIYMLNPAESRLLVLLTTKSRLLCIDSKSGNVFRRVRLPPNFQFKWIYWNNEGEDFVVAARRKSKPDQNNPSQVFRPGSFEYGFCVFGVCPFRFIGSFSVACRVFGPVERAIVRQDLLVLMKPGHLVELYQSPAIQPTANSNVSFLDSSEVALANIAAAGSLQLLYSLYSYRHVVEFGGFPWHCLYQPMLSKSKPEKCFALKRMFQEPDDEQQHTVETLQQKTAFPPDSVAPVELLPALVTLGLERNVFFHGEESGRLIYIENNNHLKVLQINSEVAGGSRAILQDHFAVDPDVLFGHSENISQPTKTSSGRTVKVQTYGDQSNKLTFIDDVHYEENLDWLWVVTCSSSVESVDNNGGCALVALDNLDGTFIKHVPLLAPWDDVDQHIVHIDLDTIIHVVKAGHSSKRRCSVYKLVETDMD